MGKTDRQKTELGVEVYSDYTCPWCYIGSARLDRLRARIDDHVDLRVEWLPFEIHPEVPEDGMPVEELPYSRDEWEQMMERLRAQAADEGLAIGDRPHVSNTHEALMAGTWVQEEHPDAFEDFHQALFRAYFEEGRDIGRRSVLLAVAGEAGLDGDELGDALDEGACEEALERTRRRARRLGISGTPTFVFGGTHAAVGAQPVENLLRAARQALADGEPGGG